MKISANTTVLAGDFETTVFEGQEFTEVWAGALVPLYTEDVTVVNSIDATWASILDYDKDLIIYFHNLKFDGSFWIHFFEFICGYKQAYRKNKDEIPNRFMDNNSYKYVISDLGQWYTITVKVNNHIIEFRDSLKLIPLSIAEMGKAFKTKHRKTEIEYVGYRGAGGEIKPNEKEYIANDVLVLKESLEYMFNQGHNKLTIGACCLAEFKSFYSKDEYAELFPNLYEIPIPEEYGAKTAGDYIHKSYKGGWCYLKEEEAGKLQGQGFTADVNSLYPFSMMGDSGNKYPVGKPHLLGPEEMECSGSDLANVKKQLDWMRDNDYYYFVRFQCGFDIKAGKLPTIQIKNDIRYKGNVWLKTSRVSKDNKYYEYIESEQGAELNRVTLTLTLTDFDLFCEHYDIRNFKVLDAMYFRTEIGLFDGYMQKYKEQKENSTGGMRTIAKLYMNNLYGKTAAGTNSSYKLLVRNEEKPLTLKFELVERNDKIPGYIAIGSAITSYARNYTIRCAQANYKNFIYADTDSVHCKGYAEDFKGGTVHKTKLGCWDIESKWDKSIFVRQKTYIEHVTETDDGTVKPYHDIKAAGMTKRPKELLAMNFERDLSSAKSVDEEAFLLNPMSYTDFKLGLEIPSQLKAKRIIGGVLLECKNYVMR